MYIGPPIDDPAMLERVPATLRDLLARANGYVAYDGGLHVRGACLAPAWHALREAWDGPDAYHRLYPALSARDIPFAEDALGDQLLLRDDVVHRLSAETGELDSLGLDLADFDAAVREDPVGVLSLAPLERFLAEGGRLEPGQLLDVYPPFCMAPSEGVDVSLRAIAAADRKRWLASLARQIRTLPEGAAVEIVMGRAGA